MIYDHAWRGYQQRLESTTHIAVQFKVNATFGQLIVAAH